MSVGTQPGQFEGYGLQAKPRYATLRDPARRTLGGRIARIGAALGTPFMPWQQYVHDVAGELDAAGQLVYEIVLVTVPRQSGKTTLVWPLTLERAMFNPASRVFYTAQSGKDARGRFRDCAQLVTDSPFAELVSFRWSMGNTGVTMPGGGEVCTFAPSHKAIHGETPPLVVLDEIFAYDEALGDALLEGAIIPAQFTLAGRRQVWMVSTAGTAESTFMRKWVERGRRGEVPKMAYFEWSMNPGDDEDDLDVIASYHPAVGNTVNGRLITAESVRDVARKTTTRSERLRAFCNVWTEAAQPLIDLDLWDELATPTPAPRRSEIAIGYDVAPDGAAASVMAAWRDPAGRPRIHTVHTAPGTAWLVPYLLDLAEQWKPRVITADDGGDTRAITDELTRAGVPVEPLTARDAATAGSTLIAAARDRTLGHDGSQTLRRAIAAAQLRTAGDTARFSRRHSPGLIAGLIAATAALWAYDHHDAPLPKPTITF